MNCDELLRRFAENQPLDASAQAHLAGCPNCAEILTWASAAHEFREKPDPEHLARIRGQITSDWRPIKPIASNLTILIWLLLLFLFLTIGAALLTGYVAIHALHPL